MSSVRHEGAAQVRGWLTLAGYLLLAPFCVLWWAVRWVTRPLRTEAGGKVVLGVAMMLLGLWLRAR
jgi:hypothetical protein